MPEFRISYENLLKDQRIFSMMIIFIIVITFSFDYESYSVVKRKLMLITLRILRVEHLSLHAMQIVSSIAWGWWILLSGQ